MLLFAQGGFQYWLIIGTRRNHPAPDRRGQLISLHLSTHKKQLFQDVLTTIGGKAILTRATMVSYNSTGVSYEFQEDPEPINGKVADARYSLTYSLDGAHSRQHWQMDNEYAYEAHPDFVETIDGTKGTSVGVNGFFPENFASFGVQGDPMYSSKIGARQKSLMMSSPLAMLKLIDGQGTIADSDSGTISVGYNVSPLGYGSDTPDIELVLDAGSKLPVRAQVLENDPLLGDVIYEVSIPSEPVANDLDVYRISGSLQSHYSYAFKVGDELLIYDAPANNRRTAAVNTRIRRDFSTLPIRYVVLSHNHFDHTGGWRGALAEGGIWW